MNYPIFTVYIDDGGTGSLGIKIEMTDEMLCERILEHGMPLILRGGPQDQTLVGVEGQIRKNLVISVALLIVASCIDAQTFVCISSGGPTMDPEPCILGDGPFCIHLKKFEGDFPLLVPSPLFVISCVVPSFTVVISGHIDSVP